MTSRTLIPGDLAGAVTAIDQAVPDSRAGLPDDLFYLVSRMTPLINVDLLVGNERGEILLTWRHDRFYGPGWHIPGGIIRFKEHMHDRIQAVARQELQARVVHDPEPMAVTEIMNPSRDIRGHFISLTFRCSLLDPLPPDTAASSDDGAKPGQWRWFSSMPGNMITQHQRFKAFFEATHKRI